METASSKEVWAGFMEAVHEEKPLETFEVPSGVVDVAVDPETGERATPYSPTSKVMYYKKGDEHDEHCTLHYNNNKEDKKIEKKEYKEEKESKRFFEK